MGIKIEEKWVELRMKMKKLLGNWGRRVWWLKEIKGKNERVFEEKGEG